jgi:hypothetical protein
MFVVANERLDHFLREWNAAVEKYEEADRESNGSRPATWPRLTPTNSHGSYRDDDPEMR